MGMTDEERIRFILEAEDNASAKIAQVGDAMNGVKNETSSLTGAIKTFGPAVGALAAGATASYMAFMNEEDAITRAARATSTAAGSFDTAKESISQLNDKLERQGISTEETTNAVVLLTTKVGLDFNDAIARSADLIAFAKERNVELSGAIRILMKDTEDQKQAIQNAEDALKDNTKETEENERAMKSLDDQVNDYVKSIQKLKEELAPTTNETRRLRDLNTDLTRTQEDGAEAAIKLGNELSQAEQDGAKETKKRQDEYTKAAAKYGENSEQAITASARITEQEESNSRKIAGIKARIADQEESTGRRTTDIRQRITDTTDDMTKRQEEVGESIKDYEAKIADAGAESEKMKTKTKDLADEHAALEAELTKSNEATKANLALLDGANKRMLETADSADRMAKTMETVDKLLGGVGKAISPVANLFYDFFDKVSVGYDTLVTILDVDGWFIGKGIENIANFVAGVKLGIDDLVEKVTTAITNFIKDIETKWGAWITGLIQGIIDFGTKILDQLTGKEGIVGKITKAFTDLIASGLTWGTDLVANILKGIIDKAVEIGAAIAKAGSDFWKGITGGSTGLVSQGVTPLAEGGIISRPTMAILGEGGENEYVIPESKMRNWMGRGDTSVVIHVHAANDPIRTADEVGRRVLSVLGASNSTSVAGVFM